MKENKIEKLILDLSNRWDCSPQEAVDRLNSMNESEIKKLVSKIENKAEKFFLGGLFGKDKASADMSDYHMNMPDGSAYTLSKGNNGSTEMSYSKGKEGILQTILQRDIQDGDTVVRYKGNIVPNDNPIYNRINQRMDNYKSKFIDGFYGFPMSNHLKETKQFQEGGIIKCLHGGKTYAECKKCGGKTPVIKNQEPAEKLTTKTNDGKTRRTDRPGYAWTHADGTDVLTQDAVGPQPLPGSYYEIPGSTPEYETWRTALTNKGGDILGYNYSVYLNDGDHIFSPVNKYTTKRMWNKPSTWLRRELTPERAAEMKAAYDANKLAKGGSIEKDEDGTKIGSATYQIKKGDNLIKIARQFGLNSLDEILSLNPQIKNPNMIYEGQVLNLPKDKMKQNGKLDAASVSDKMPNYDQVAYAELPESVRAKVDAYASAINDHKIKYTDVPTLYRQQAYNQSIRQDTNNAAPMIATKALMAPWTIPDTVIRGGLNEARKLVNGKDDSGDYGVGDYFDGNFSWLGKKHQEEHPVADAVINAITTPVIMAGAENVAARAMDGTLSGTMARASANAKATARTMGVQPEPITVEYTMGKTGGHSYKGPGAGRAHTRGGVNNASYRQVPVSSKVVDPMNFVENPAASGFTGTGYWHGFPAVLPEQEKPNYVMVEPEKEYMEETIVSPNKWIYDTRTPDVVVPYALGDETITYTKGNANRGRSPEEQAIMKESIETGQGNPKPGVKVKKGEVTGSPSGYYSGFGYTYGTEGGPWLTYQQKGGILNKYKKK